MTGSGVLGHKGGVGGEMWGRWRLYRLTLADLGMPKAMLPRRCWDEYPGGGLPYESDGNARRLA